MQTFRQSAFGATKVVSVDSSFNPYRNLFCTQNRFLYGLFASPLILRPGDELEHQRHVPGVLRASFLVNKLGVVDFKRK